jgi:hypothetical protein
VKKAIFIGVLSHGTTSKSQADWLRRITPDCEWQGIDVDGPFQSQPRWSRSLAFRLRWGPAVAAVNRFVLQSLPSSKVDLVWIGKGVLLYPSTVQRIRQLAQTIIYYTPDTAFYGNRSRFFNATMSSYDLIVTTKSFEVEQYHRYVDPEKLFLTTQGYDPNIHFPRTNVKKKKHAVLIGLCEPDREECVRTLRANQIPVVIGGKGWENIVRSYYGEEGFTFLGETVFGESYARAICEATIGLGLMSKKFPELHTTRTMEIPACGTILATQKTSETTRFFKDDEVLFFDNFHDLAQKIQAHFSDPDHAQKVADRGRHALLSQPFSYPQIMSACLNRVGFETVLPTSTK